MTKICQRSGDVARVVADPSQTTGRCCSQRRRSAPAHLSRPAFEPDIYARPYGGRFPCHTLSMRRPAPDCKAESGSQSHLEGIVEPPEDKCQRALTSMWNLSPTAISNRPQRRASAASSSLVPTPVGQTDRFDARRNGSVLAYLAAARRGPHDVSGVTCWRAIRLRRIHPNTAVECERDREADGCAERAPGENADHAADEEGWRPHELQSEHHLGHLPEAWIPHVAPRPEADRIIPTTVGTRIASTPVHVSPMRSLANLGWHHQQQTPPVVVRTTTTPEMMMQMRTRRCPTIQGRRDNSGIAKAIPLVIRIIAGAVRTWAPRTPGYRQPAECRDQDQSAGCFR